MIQTDEIDSKALEFKISPRNVEKDYVFGWLLNGIYNNPILGQKLILKGGNAVRKGYLENTRFSKDLDFSIREDVDTLEVHDEINKVLKYIHENAGINFLLNKTEVLPKLVINSKQVYEGRAIFKGFYEEEEANIKIHLDITEFDKIILPTQKLNLIHPYSDAELCKSEIHCHKLEEILASKLVSLLQRRKAGDIFDLAYAIIRSQDYNTNRLEILTTFLKKTIYESQPQIVRKQLEGLDMEESRPFWNKIIAPVASLFEFDEAIRQFNETINVLFGLIPSPAFAPIGYGTTIRRPSSSYGTGYSGGLSYYPNNYRDMIINAGESLKMLRLLYHGVWRHVEPYALKYHVRKKDNRGLEYFWAFDTTGGNSGKTTIKQFISDDIQAMEPTEQSFTPQWPVEL